MIITQRSRLEQFESCPRRGYYSYLHGGKGIQRRGFDPDLLIGTAVHAGIELLLKGVLVGVPYTIEDEAAAGAVIIFSKAINEVGLAPMVVESPSGFEQVTFTPSQETFMVHLVEALIRGFARVRLPRLLEQYKILDVEREEVYQLTPDMKFLSRSDFITERLSDGELFIHNLKSVKWPDGAWRKKFHYDQQTLSELLGAEERYGRKFGGVIIEGLVKGIKNVEYPRGSGIRYNSSPLVWAWVGPDNPPFPADVKIKYEYVDESGRNRRLGPTYQRVPAYTVMPIRDWIDKVEREAPEVLESQFVTLPPVLRNEHEIESWKISTKYKEMDIGTRLLGVKAAEAGGGGEKAPKEVILDMMFLKHTSNGNCLGYGDTTCSFFKICHEGANPDDTDLFMPRVLNHPTEDDNDSKKVASDVDPDR